MSALDDIRERMADEMSAIMESHYLDLEYLGPDDNASCICDEWGEGEMSPSWDDHLAEVLVESGPVHRLLGALDAVLALHTEDEQGKCAECTFAPFSVHSVKWPCPTVAAVNDALEAGK